MKERLRLGMLGSLSLWLLLLLELLLLALARVSCWELVGRVAQ